jgi:hypothetical protein
MSAARSRSRNPAPRCRPKRALGTSPTSSCGWSATWISTRRLWRAQQPFLKDRSRRLDGKQFGNPTFATFLPHIEFMALGGKHEAVNVERTSEDQMPDDDAPLSDMKSIRRGIVLDELEALLVKHYPSTAAVDKQAKAALVLKHFGTPSWTEISKLMPLVDLQKNYDSLHRELENAPSRYGVQEARNAAPAGPIDEIPHLEPAKEAATETPVEPAKEPAKQDDTHLDQEASEAALAGFTADIDAAHTLNKITRVWKKWDAIHQQCSNQAEFLRIRAEAMKRVKDASEAREQNDAERLRSQGYSIPVAAE